jgi:N-methylhydantoinase B
MPKSSPSLRSPRAAQPKKSGASGLVDPVTKQLVKGALRALQAEMEALIERTAMSPFIREKKDFFSGVFDAQGHLIIGTNIPVFGDLIRPLFERFSADQMVEGDVYWYNDCYGSGGGVSHSPDQVYVSPIFVEGALVGFIQSWAHFSDVGGMRPGSLSPDATEIFQEGTIVPPVRLYAAGVFNEDAFRIFQRNSRYPDMVLGDTRACVAAVRLGEKRLKEMFDTHGRKPVLRVFDDLLAETESTIRRKLESLFPKGSYRFTDLVDTDGHGNGPFRVCIELQSTGRAFRIDASESDNQSPGAINYLMHPDVPCMVFGIYLLADEPQILLNQGAVRAFESVTLREGSILKPRFPAALGQRGVTLVRVISACLGVIGQATGGASVAASNVYALYYLRGRQESGAQFLLTDGVAVGNGARPYADGIDAVYFVAQENYPAEFLDNSYPVRLLRYEIHCDSGGAGRWRGGAGVVREFELLAPSAMLSNRIDANAHPPWGIRGGKMGGRGRCIVNPGRPGERQISPIADGTMLERGDIFRMETGGGGGWGHPFDREPEQVRSDVLGGFVSVERALSDYGVILTGPARDLDLKATTAHRAAHRPVDALFHRHQYRNSLEEAETGRAEASSARSLA